jgi:pyroglutamyl-peptidase
VKKVLLSGFGTFDEHKENSSQIIAEMFRATKIDGLEIRVVILPVTFAKSFEDLKIEIDTFKPDYIVSLGLAGNRKAIELEKVAVNLIHTRGGDNDGVSLQDHVIDELGPVGYFSTLPLIEMREVESAFPVKMSFSAGAYVCNYLMYKTLRYVEGTSTKAGFIHLPHLNSDKDKVFESIFNMIKILLK